jgi:hypothetical protein
MFLRWIEKRIEIRDLHDIREDHRRRGGGQG